MTRRNGYSKLIIMMMVVNYIQGRKNNRKKERKKEYKNTHMDRILPVTAWAWS